MLSSRAVNRSSLFAVVEVLVCSENPYLTYRSALHPPVFEKNPPKSLKTNFQGCEKLLGNLGKMVWNLKEHHNFAIY